MEAKIKVCDLCERPLEFFEPGGLVRKLVPSDKIECRFYRPPRKFKQDQFLEALLCQECYELFWDMMNDTLEIFLQRRGINRHAIVLRPESALSGATVAQDVDPEPEAWHRRFLKGFLTSGTD